MSISISRYLTVIVPLLLLIQACSLFRSVHEEEFEIHYPNPDPEIEWMIREYREGIQLRLGERVAIVEDTLAFTKPEGSLGNMVADALRYRAALELGRFVHLGVTDDSRFTTQFVPGLLTRESIYEFIPYEGHLVILELKGDRVVELLHQVAALEGAPVSGARFTIDQDKRARGILINSTVVDPAGTYLVATTSRDAESVYPFPALSAAVGRTDTDISIRTLYLDFFRGRGRLTEMKDGRIRS